MQKVTITLTPVFAAPCVTAGFHFSQACYVCNKVCGPIHSEGRYFLPPAKCANSGDRQRLQTNPKKTHLSAVGQALSPNTLWKGCLFTRSAPTWIAQMSKTIEPSRPRHLYAFLAARTITLSIIQRPSPVPSNLVKPGKTKKFRPAP